MDIQSKSTCDRQAALGALSPLYDLGQYSISYGDAASAMFSAGGLYGSKALEANDYGFSLAAPAAKTMNYVGYAGRAVDIATGLLNVSQGIRKDIDGECRIGGETMNAIAKSTAQISAAGLTGTVVGGAALAFLAPAGVAAAAGVAAFAGAAAAGGIAAGVAGYAVGKAYDAVVSWFS